MSVVRSIRFPTDLLANLLAKARANDEPFNALVVRMLGGADARLEAVRADQGPAGGTGKKSPEARRVEPHHDEPLKVARAGRNRVQHVQPDGPVQDAGGLGRSQGVGGGKRPVRGARKRPDEATLKAMPMWQRRQFGWE